MAAWLSGFVIAYNGRQREARGSRIKYLIESDSKAQDLRKWSKHNRSENSEETAAKEEGDGCK